MQTLPPDIPSDSPAGVLDILGRMVRAWNRFWFSPADPTTLGLIRLCAGLVVLYIHLIYTFDLQLLLGKHAWVDHAMITQQRHEVPSLLPPSNWTDPYATLSEPQSPEEKAYIDRFKYDWGPDPRLAYAKGNALWSVWYHVIDPTWMMVAHAFILVSIFLFTIGCCTRVTSVLTWFGVISYVQRAPTTLFGMDTMMMILTLYLAIGPSGAALSVDRLIERWWARRRARQLHQPPPAAKPPQPLVTANFVIRLMQIHFCFIYLASGLSKLLGAAWWNGTALWMTMANPLYNPLDVPLYMQFLMFLCRHRWLWELVTSTGVVFTLALEIGLPFLIWNRRLRWLLIIGAVLLHTGIALTMGLIGFGLFMLCLVLSFVPPETVRHQLEGLDSWVRGLLAGRSLKPPTPSESLAAAR